MSCALPVSMLVSIGRREKPGDLVALLLECHEKIRTFVRLAELIGTADPTHDETELAEVVDSCCRCERYFAQALPLHVLDEEESILPRMSGLGPEVDVALLAMHQQHTEHRPILDLLLTSLRAVAHSPADLTLRATLRQGATIAVAEFEKHLSIEEQVLFPALRAHLSLPVQRDIIDELRARRQIDVEKQQLS